jgi:hypothetical protein
MARSGRGVSAAAELGSFPPETSFYQTIIEAGRVLGWRVHHQRSTRNGTPISGDTGFPDFVLVHPGRPGRPGHLLFVELKSDRKGARLTPAQEAWALALLGAGGRWMVVHVPSGLDELLALMSDLALQP